MAYGLGLVAQLVKPERYPTSEEFELVKRAEQLYVTHSHPDHFHWPTLRAMGPRSLLLPKFPHYMVPAFCESNGFSVKIAEPWQWYRLGKEVRVAAIPVPFDDSILVIDTPKTTIVNLNDTNARRTLLEEVRREMVEPGKPLVVLKSYSPASGGNTMFIKGQRVPMKTKADYTAVAQRMAEALGATDFVPFASKHVLQTLRLLWANHLKVTFEDLERFWTSKSVALCPPFITMDLDTRTYMTDYTQGRTATCPPTTLSRSRRANSRRRRSPSRAASTKRWAALLRARAVPSNLLPSRHRLPARDEQPRSATTTRGKSASRTKFRRTTTSSSRYPTRC